MSISWRQLTDIAKEAERQQNLLQKHESAFRAIYARLI